jgi:hypothetical protein
MNAVGAGVPLYGGEVFCVVPQLASTRAADAMTTPRRKEFFFCSFFTATVFPYIDAFGVSDGL